MLKLYAWESQYIEKILGIRRREMSDIARFHTSRVLNVVVNMTGPSFMIFFAYLTLVYVRGSLNAADVFSSIVLCSLHLFFFLLGSISSSALLQSIYSVSL